MNIFIRGWIKQKGKGLARGQKQGRKTKDHGLINVIGLLQACPRRQIILRMKHYSCSYFNVLTLTLVFFGNCVRIPFFGNFLSFIYSIFFHILTSYLYLTRFSLWHLFPYISAEGGRRSCLAMNYTVHITSSSMQLIKLLSTI